MMVLEEAWFDALRKFIAAYEVAAESAMGVPREVYKIAPLAARYLAQRGGANSPIARALSAAPDVDDVLRLVLLFHAGGPWDEAKGVEWLRITGTTEATSKVLCDQVRSALGGGLGRDSARPSADAN
jgi:hypothetical protein